MPHKMGGIASNAEVHNVLRIHVPRPLGHIGQTPTDGRLRVIKRDHLRKGTEITCRRPGRAPEKCPCGSGGGGGSWSRFSRPPPLEGVPKASSLFSMFSCIFQIIGFSYHTAELPCHLLEPFGNCRMLLAKAHPVTTLVPICHTGGEQTTAL